MRQGIGNRQGRHSAIVGLVADAIGGRMRHKSPMRNLAIVGLAAVVAAADEASIRVKDSRTDGEAAFGEAGAGFFEGDAEHGGVVGGAGLRGKHGLLRIQGSRRKDS